MKKIFNIFAAALMSAAVLTSCAEKEIVTYYPDEVVIPALQELSVEEGLQLSDGDGVIFATLQFSAADFGIATAARYTAYADIKEDFSSKQALANVTTDTAGIAISAATLNNALITLGCPDSVDVKVYFRIETQMMGESSPVERVEALVSNSVSAVVKPYDAEKVGDGLQHLGTPMLWLIFTVMQRMKRTMSESWTSEQTVLIMALRLPETPTGTTATGVQVT